MKKLSNRTLLIIILAIDIVLCGTFIFTRYVDKKEPSTQQISAASVRRICELATLECYYHNVSEWSNPGGIFQAGKKLWLEYDGIIRVGIKAEVKISEPDESGVITVTIPEAAILEKDLDEDSIYEIDSEAPLWGFLPYWGSVTTEERKEALAQAQVNMEESASHNQMIMSEAKERAKKIIEKNILAIGEASGTQYKVRFVSASEAEETATIQPDAPIV